jgi:arginase family enzyme
MDYRPKDAKPHFDPAAFVRDMEMIGGHFPYAGILTFFRQPHTRDLTAVDVAFLGLPWDGTPMNRSGQRFGPRALRETSAYVVQEEDFTVFERVRCVDYGDLFFHAGNMFDFLDQAEKTVGEILAAGARVISFGGDHMIPLPIVRAYAKRFGKPLSLIHFDGHFDNWDTFPYSWGGSWVTELADEGCIDLSRSVQLGIRMVGDAAPAVDMYAPHSDAVVISGDECLDEGPLVAAERVREVVRDNAAYLTFDADFLDASVAPACHTPCVCGPDTYWTKRFFRAIRGLKVVGADVNELCPQYEPPLGPTQLALGHVAQWELELMAAALEKR